MLPHIHTDISHKSMQNLFVSVIYQRIHEFDNKDKKKDDAEVVRHEKIAIARDYLGEKLFGVSEEDNMKVPKGAIKFKAISADAKSKAQDRYYALDKVAKTISKISKWGRYKRLMGKSVLNDSEVSEMNSMFRGV